MRMTLLNLIVAIKLIPKEMDAETMYLEHLLFDFSDNSSNQLLGMMERYCANHSNRF